jgi:hypothetical protein
MSNQSLILMENEIGKISSQIVMVPKTAAAAGTFNGLSNKLENEKHLDNYQGPHPKFDPL